MIDMPLGSESVVNTSGVKADHSTNSSPRNRYSFERHSPVDAIVLTDDVFCPGKCLVDLALRRQDPRFALVSRCSPSRRWPPIAKPSRLNTVHCLMVPLHRLAARTHRWTRCGRLHRTRRTISTRGWRKHTTKPKRMLRTINMWYDFIQSTVFRKSY